MGINLKIIMVKLHVLVCDMDEKVQESAKKTIMDAFDAFQEERKIAHSIKKQFDKDWNESWNCVVGKNFGSHVVHQSRSYMSACLNEEMSILLEGCVNNTD